MDPTTPRQAHDHDLAGRRARVQARLDALAKPPGSLGFLEALALALAQAQGRDAPHVHAPHVLVFAADHGVAAAHPVSAYPRGVTPLMVQTMERGQAAVSVLARQAQAPLWVIDVGVAQDQAPPAPQAQPQAQPHDQPGAARVLRHAWRAGTDDLVSGPAMTRQDAQLALEHGRLAVAQARQDGADLIALGELGIGNTTAAAALAARLLQAPASALTGPGTGLDAAGVARKAALIQRALDRQGSHAQDPLGALADVGGLELAALVGAMLEAHARDLPVLLDGFIVGAAALAAAALDPACTRAMIFATQSAEPGHALIIEALRANAQTPLAGPLLRGELRLGEASGAALAIPICRSACAILEQMATLAQVLP